MKKSLLILPILLLASSQALAIGNSININNDTPYDLTVFVSGEKKSTQPVTITKHNNKRVSTESGKRRVFWIAKQTDGHYRTEEEFLNPDEMTITAEGKKFTLIEKKFDVKTLKSIVTAIHKDVDAYVIKKADKDEMKQPDDIKNIESDIKKLDEQLKNAKGAKALEITAHISYLKNLKIAIDKLKSDIAKINADIVSLKKNKESKKVVDKMREKLDKQDAIKNLLAKKK